MQHPEFLKPRLRLFLSADIVGSTALKQSRLGAFSEAGAKNQSSWFSVIQGFYIEAPRLFLEQEWKPLSINHQGQPELFGDPPTVWKTIGDEVLFVKALTDHRQVAVTLRCWTAAVRKMRQFLKDRDARLDVKCTAWTAGFPVKNKEVVIRTPVDGRYDLIEDYYLENGRLLNAYYEGSLSGIQVDYIGPSIDIGFRLTSFATSRKFIIGVDVAYILSLTTRGPDKPIDNFKIYYGGSHTLKGVFGGVEYPVFWMDMSEAEQLPRLEDRLSGINPADRDHVQEYCEAFHKEYASYTFRPFIRSKTEQQIQKEPDEYNEVIEALAKNYTYAKQPLVEPQEIQADQKEEDEILHADNKSIEQDSRDIIGDLVAL